MNLLDIKLIIYKNSHNLKKYKLMLQDTQVGKIELNHQSTEGVTGWFLNIHINKNMRNKKLGMTALATLLTLIPLKELYANVKKSNKPSIKILEYTGFNSINVTKSGQLIYKLDYRKAINSTNLLIDSLNWEDFYPSIYTDLCNFVSNYTKKNMRILVVTKSNDYYANYFIKWCESLNYTYTLYDSFMYISKDDRSSQVKSIDNSINNHLVELGEILGYPKCCIRYISKYPENSIDAAEIAINKTRNYKGNEILLNIEDYREGLALISHIPCDPKCIESYISALLTLAFRNKIHTI